MWSGINRRKFPRVGYPCKITVRRKDCQDSLLAQTENIGIGGICVLIPKDLGIFAPVETRLDLQDGYPVVECDGTIVWIVPKKTAKKNGIYDTGIEFTNLQRKDSVRINTIVERLVKESGDPTV
ncbi:PilZ domain-containing protein [Candidatus Omnitrophota bacterium]